MPGDHVIGCARRYLDVQESPITKENPLTSSRPLRCRAAAVVVRDQKGRCLMIRENYGLRRFGFPGGRVEDGETFEEAAVREAREETGLAVTLIGDAGSLEWMHGNEPWSARLFFAQTRADVIPVVQDPREIAEVRWVEPGDLPTPLTRTATAFFRGSVSTC